MTSSLHKFLQASRKVCINSKHNLIPVRGCKTNISALFLSGRHARNSFSFLTPYIDFGEKILDIDKYQKELSLRGVNVNVSHLKDVWNVYKALVADRIAMEANMERLLEEVKNAKKPGIVINSEEKERMTKYRMKSKILREELRYLKECIWDMEELFITKLLNLPNEIDERTPLELPVILKEVGTLKKVSEEERKSHIDIGEDLGVLEYTNSTHNYLCNEAAFFELAVMKYAAEIFMGEGMLRVAGGDFCRSTLVEGLGLNHTDPMDSFILHNHSDIKKGTINRMHIVGGSSLLSFLALHARQLINPKSLPLKYFSTGRQYVPCRDHSELDGLFTVSQTSAVHVFFVIRDKNSDEYKHELDNLLDTVCKLYDNICDHYRVVTRSVSELKRWETMRVSFEIWSQFHERYIEVGHVSAHSDYLSKRLLAAYQTPTGRGFPVMISGGVLSVAKLLGCLLEQNPDKFVIPQEIIKRMPIDAVETEEVSTDLNTEEESSVKVQKQ